MIRRLLGKIIKLIVFVCIVLYTADFLNLICPAINNFLAAINNFLIPGVGTVGEVVVLIVGGLTLLGAFDDDE